MIQPTEQEAALGIRYDTDDEPIADTVLPDSVWDDDAVWRRAEELHAAHPDIVRAVNRQSHTITLVVRLPHRKFLPILGWIQHGQGHRPRIKPLAHYLKVNVDHEPRPQEETS